LCNDGRRTATVRITQSPPFRHATRYATVPDVFRRTRPLASRLQDCRTTCYSNGSDSAHRRDAQIGHFVRMYVHLCSAMLQQQQLLLLLPPPPLILPFNGLFSRVTWVSRYQKGKTSLDCNEARDDGVWGRQWHQLRHMQTICTSLHTDNHTNTPSLNCYRPEALPDAQATVSKH